MTVCSMTDARMTAKFRLLPLLGSCLMVAALSAPRAIAADAEAGKRLALMRCAPCHIVFPYQREEVANSPPFADIARNAGRDAKTIARVILSPHPGMNVRITPAEADDIAAYIATLH